MKRKLCNLYNRIWLLPVLLFLFAGCGYENPDDNEALEKPADESFLQEAVYDVFYEKPSVRPGVLVDRNGYSTEGTKVALFRGENLSGEFAVVNQETRQVVYTGKLQEPVYNKLNDEYISRGDFTALTQPGTYYIETAVIGQSYPFQIKEDIYGELYASALDSFYYHRCGTDLNGSVTVNNHRACHLEKTVLKGTDISIDTRGGWHTGSSFEKDVTEGCKIVSDLLMTYEYIEEKDSTGYSKEENSRLKDKLLNEVLYEIKWLLAMQETKTGAVYAGVYPKQPTGETAPEEDKGSYYVEEASVEATAEFAAVMAQFSRIYKGTDETFSATCLAASESAYGYVAKYSRLDDLQYYAAAELYKATGNVLYHNTLKQYWQLEEKPENSRFGRRIYGDLAYLTCTYAVDMEICNELMENLMENAETLAAASKKDVYLVWAEEDVRSAEAILKNAFVLAIIDHVVTSHEYLGIIENQLHYLLGRNEDSIEMVTGKGVLNLTGKDEEYELYLQSSIIFLVHEIVEREVVE